LAEQGKVFFDGVLVFLLPQGRTAIGQGNDLAAIFISWTPHSNWSGIRPGPPAECPRLGKMKSRLVLAKPHSPRLPSSIY
jgi:hypothetical protein